MGVFVGPQSGDGTLWEMWSGKRRGGFSRRAQRGACLQRRQSELVIVRRQNFGVYVDSKELLFQEQWSSLHVISYLPEHRCV